MEEAPSPDRSDSPSRKRLAEVKGKRKLVEGYEERSVVQKLTGMPTASSRNESSSSGVALDPTPFSSSSSEPLNPVHLSSSTQLSINPVNVHIPRRDIPNASRRYNSNARSSRRSRREIPNASRRYNSNTRSSRRSRRYTPGTSRPSYTSTNPRVLEPMQIGSGRPSTQLSNPMMPRQPYNMNTNMRFMPTPSTTPSATSTSMGYNFNNPQGNYNMHNPSYTRVLDSMQIGSGRPSMQPSISMTRQPYNMDSNIRSLDMRPSTRPSGSMGYNFILHDDIPIPAPSQPQGNIQLQGKTRLSLPETLHGSNPSPPKPMHPQPTFSGGFNTRRHPNVHPSTSKPLSPTGTGSSSVPLSADDFDDDLCKYMDQLYDPSYEISGPSYTSTDPRVLDSMQIGEPSTQLSNPMMPRQPYNMNNNIGSLDMQHNVRFMPTPSTRPSGSSMGLFYPQASHPQPSFSGGYNMPNPTPLSHPNMNMLRQRFNMHNPSTSHSSIYPSTRPSCSSMQHFNRPPSQYNPRPSLSQYLYGPQGRPPLLSEVVWRAPFSDSFQGFYSRPHSQSQRPSSQPFNRHSTNAAPTTRPSTSSQSLYPQPSSSGDFNMHNPTPLSHTNMPPPLSGAAGTSSVVVREDPLQKLLDRLNRDAGM